jgi:hypothetical protein
MLYHSLPSCPEIRRTVPLLQPCCTGLQSQTSNEPVISARLSDPSGTRYSSCELKDNLPSTGNACLKGQGLTQFGSHNTTFCQQSNNTETTKCWPRATFWSKHRVHSHIQSPEHTRMAGAASNPTLQTRKLRHSMLSPLCKVTT